MLNSFYVRNFRVFDEVKLSKLAPVNLVVGRNNAGKTCLLEALRLYGERGSSSCVRALLRQRDELHPDEVVRSEFASAHGSRESAELLDPAQSLFHGYQFPDAGDGILLGPLHDAPGDSPRLRLTVQAVERREAADGRIEEALMPIHEATEGASPRLVVQEKTLDGSWTVVRSRRLRSDLTRPMVRGDDGPTAVRTIGSRADDSTDIAELWSNVVVRPDAREFVAGALRLVDSKISEVVVLPTRRRRSGVDAILLYEDGTRAPMRSLGDGIQRLFEIALATASEPTDMILIDEFENGLHWSIQEMLWQNVVDTAERIGAQVVATTHSWDCILAFRNVMARRPGRGQLVHLGKGVRTSERGKIIATTYDCEELEHATKAELEVR